MKLKIIVTYAHRRRHRTKKVIVDVDSTSANFVECCKRATGECYTIAFTRYYSNLDLMNFKRCFPYIIREGKCVWKEPYDSVTIKDFFETNNIKENDSVYVDVDAFGSAYDCLDILSWIATIWPIIEPYIELTGVTIDAVGLVMKVIKFFGNKANKVPNPIDIRDFVNSKREWKMDELIQKTGINDRVVLDLLLLNFGYEKKGEVYRYNEILKIKQERLRSSVVNGKSESYESMDDDNIIAEYICDINTYLSAVEVISAVDNINIFNQLVQEIDFLCERYACLDRGDKEFNYLIINEDDLEEKDVEEIEIELGKIREMLFVFLDEYYSK